MGGEVFTLDHLHPHDWHYVIPAKGQNPERRFTVNVSYGLHCFTRTPQSNETVPVDGWYSDSREQRAFCHERWKLSKRLPEIIASLGQRKCLHTGREEFTTIQVVEEGRIFDYAVFFVVTKAKKSGGDLNLFIVSAHERYNALPHKKPIRFDVILVNRYKGKAIKVPR